MNRLPIPIQNLISNPRRLFLIDSLGALLTAVLLLAVVANFESFFGMPQPAVYGLAAIALVFATYSGTCYGLVTRWRPFLTGIAMANLTYCALSLGLLVYFYSRVTAWGVAYFLIEISVIISLIALEWAAVRRPQPLPNHYS